MNGQLRIGIFASSKSCNCAIRLFVLMTCSIEAIKEYEEVLFDYGDTFFNE